MVILRAASDKLLAELSTGGPVDYVIDDASGRGSQGTLNNDFKNIVLSGPNNAVSRMTFTNRSGGSLTITFYKEVESSQYQISPSITVADNETLYWDTDVLTQIDGT
jgi:hypothetical protein